MKISLRPAALIAISAVLGLSACSRDPAPSETLVEDNLTTEVPVAEPSALNTGDVAPPENVALNVTNAAAAPPEFTDTEQMRDDADATGLTARLPSEEAPASTANESQPAER